MDLTRKERLMLNNQFRILAALYPHEADTYNAMSTVVARGYAGSYPSLVDRIDKDEVSPETCAEVKDILDLHVALQSAAKKYPSAAAASDVDFPGFDGNEESDRHAYVCFLVKEEKRWTHVRAQHGLNSHHPTMERYRRMLHAWRALPADEKFQLSEPELNRILAAGD